MSNECFDVTVSEVCDVVSATSKDFNNERNIIMETDADLVPFDLDVPEPSTPTSHLGLSPDVIGRTATGGANHDLFDPEKLRVSQDFVGEAGVEKVHSVFPVRKPGKEFFMVCSGEEWPLLVAFIDSEDGKDFWIVVPELVPLVANEVSYRLLRLAVNRDGDAFLWPLKVLPGGQRNAWNDSAMVAAEEATTRWVRVTNGGSQYNIMVSKANYGDPKWPELSFSEILKLAFKDRIIDDYNHPVLQRLRGEI